jgi:cytochrome bd ubiquinol oxidase subunit II
MMPESLSPWAEILYGIIGMALVLYVLTGGADLGSGLWSLLASGPRKGEQRRAIQEAIAPIWEANHVWLIFVIVVMFSAFPRAFAVISVALHIPLALALLGIVLRGAGFVFHAYGIRSGRGRATWERVFAWASLATPLMLGTVVGGISTGEIRMTDGVVTTGFLTGWITPFGWLSGLFALALCSLLAAVYLTADTENLVREDFRKRAIIAEIATGPIAALVVWRAYIDAPALFRALAASSWTWPVQVGAAASAFATLGLLAYHRFTAARFTAALQVALVVLGWGLAMQRHFVVPDVSLYNAGSQPAVLPWLVAGTLGGSILLVPSLIYLYRIFKLGSPEAVVAGRPAQ